MENGGISDSSITSSGYYVATYPPADIKIDNENMWIVSPHELNHTNHWLLVDLGKVLTIEKINILRKIPFYRHIRRITPSWLETFSLLYSNNSKDFVDYGKGKTSKAGNINLNPVITARYIKILPKTWHNTIAFLMELYVKAKGGN